MAAPGGYGGTRNSNDIYSTTPNYPYTLGGAQTYDYMFGTSMAAPHVSGVAALILSIDPDLSPSQVREIIEYTADKVPGMSGQDFTNKCGYGRINALKAALKTSGYLFVSGSITSNTIWSGGVFITGDVVINSGVTLTIQADTEILFDSNRDDQSSGYFDSKSEIIVNGTLQAYGYEENRIEFVSSASNPTNYDWGGFLFNSGSNGYFNHCVVKDCYDAFWVVGADNLMIDNSEISKTCYHVLHFENCLEENNDDMDFNYAIENSEIMNSQYGCGIDIDNSDLFVHNCTV